MYQLSPPSNEGRVPTRTGRRGLRWLAFLLAGWASLFAPLWCAADTTNYLVHGVVKEVRPAERQLIIAHEAIPQLMEAMTMPFSVKDVALLSYVVIGDRIAFELHVTENDSWVDHIERLGVAAGTPGSPAASPQGNRLSAAQPAAPAPSHSRNPLRDYSFTNELGQPMRLSDFRGQAIALTFFFTRCPLPQYCPRLSRNFEEVQRKLTALPNAPTNWHLVSVTFDPTRDTPAVLKAYATGYHYDPAHWSFLTGPPDKIAELARLCDVQFTADGGFFNHNFRTLIIDASNRLQMVFPTSGDLSDGIVQELLKGAAATNQSPLATARSRPASN